MGETFERYPVASFSVAGLKLSFPVRVIRDRGGNRIVQRERPYRDGAKLDDTGSLAKVWQMEVLFENTIQEPGLEENGIPLYPDVLNQLITLFDVHETGDLVVPTIGGQRARAETYNRVERFDSQDSGFGIFTFVEDNEDDADFRIITAPTANANARRLGQTTTFDAQSSEVWSEELSDLEKASAELETVSNGVGEVNADVEDASNNVRRLSKKAGIQFQQPQKEGRTQLKDPKNARVERKLLQQRDMAARATIDTRRGRPQLITIVLSISTSVFALSGLLGQDFADLLAINPSLRGNPFFIPVGTQVRVFATTGFLNAASAG